MTYYAKVRTVFQGKSCQAEIYVGGTSRGFTNRESGELVVELKYDEQYGVSAHYDGKSQSRTIRRGDDVLFMF
jgi:hypothetical protein